MSTPSQIITDAGFPNAEAAVNAAARGGLDLSTALAKSEGESGLKNIYGNDLGGVFGRATEDEPARYDKWVTPENFHNEFLPRVREGAKSNGVGPDQITWPPLFDMAEDMGLDLSDPEDNMTLGNTLFRQELARYGGDLRLAATMYRYGQLVDDEGNPMPTEYADELLKRKAAWDALLQGAGDTPTTTRIKSRGRGRKTR